jgi:hypothetical protein
VVSRSEAGTKRSRERKSPPLPNDGLHTLPREIIVQMQDAHTTENPILAEALRLRDKHGIFCFPADRKEKKPAYGFTIKEYTSLPDREVVASWKEWGWPGTRLAAKTGAISGLFVLDADSEAARAFLKEKGLPPGPMVQTPRDAGGLHYPIRHPGFPVKTTSAFAGIEGLDIRGDGGIAILPPSADPKSTRAYEWLISLDEATLPEAPEWLLTLLKRDSKDKTPIDVANTMAGVEEGKRDTALTSLAGKFRQMNIQQDVAEAMVEFAAGNCEPPFNKTEARAKVKWIYINCPPGDDGARLVIEPPPPPSDKSSNPLLAGLIDIAAAIERGIEPPEELEPDILLAGKVHHIFAPAAVGKSWLALWLAKRCLERGQNVLYLDAENGPFIVSERLEALGADTSTIRNHLSYLASPALDLRPETVAYYLQLVDVKQPELVVFDSWVGFLGAAGLSEDSNDDVTKWSANFLKPLKDRGVTATILDHVPHEGQRSRGASRKKDEVDVQFRMVKGHDFDRETCGDARLHVEKDRLGWLPRTITFSIGGTVGGGFVFCRSDGVSFADTSSDLTDKQTTVLNVLREEFGTDGARFNEWKKASEKKRVAEKTFKRAKDALIRGHLVRQGSSPNDPKYYPAYPEKGSSGHDPDFSPQISQFPIRGHQGSFRGHDPGGEQQGSQGSHPYRGDPMTPPADPDLISGQRLTPEQAREVQKLIAEGVAPKFARREVLGGDVERF